MPGMADIQFIKDHSEKTGFILNIDSSLRDKNAYPTASNFTVKFDQNFHYVFGMNVIDASMPSSMYNIENLNNTLKYHLVWFSDVSLRQTFYKTYFVELHAFGAFDSHFKDVTSDSVNGILNAVTKRVVICKEGTSIPINSSGTDIEGEPNLCAVRKVSPPIPDLTRVESIVEDATYYFIGGSGKVIEDNSLGNLYMTTSPSTIEEMKPFIRRKDLVAQFQRQYRDYPVYRKLDRAMNVNVVPDVMITPKAEFVTYTFYPFSNNEYTRVFSKDTKSVLNWCDLIMQSSSVSLDPGNYDLYSFRDQFNNAMDRTFVINSTSGGSVSFPFQGSEKIRFVKPNEVGDVTKTGKLKLTMTSKLSLFFLDIGSSSLKDVMGFSSIPRAVEKDASYKVVRMEPDKTYICSVNQGVTEEQAIIPHGVVYLLGARYVTLRCPEIESYMSFTNNASKGIGVFKLAINQQTVQQRLDFVQYLKKPFNPVEKLSKLTFRFELPDGSLYDFKGIDMFMIIQINCYVPTMEPFTGSLLNPDYNPNLLEYQKEQYEREANLESSEESNEDDDIVQDVNAYMQDVSSKASNI